MPDTHYLVDAPGHYTFDLRQLSMLAAGHGITHWSYRAPGLLHVAMVAGFFDNARDRFQHGDLMTIAAVDGTAMRVVHKSRNAVELDFLR